MKKKIALLLSAVMFLAVLVIPAHAADTVYNLIDDSKVKEWTDTELNGNSTTRNFTDGKLIISAPGAYPYTTSELKEPIVLTAADNATVNVKFKVEDDGGTSSIRLVVGENYIWLHNYAKDPVIESGSGDIKAGTYEISEKVFDLKMFDKLVDGAAVDKDLVLDDGKLVIDGIQVWCSGSSSDIKVTFEKFEIVVPGEADATEDTEPAKSEVVNLAKGKSYTILGQLLNEAGDAYQYPDTDGKELTDGKFSEVAGYGDAAYVGFNTGSKDLPEGETKTHIIVDLTKKESLKKFVVYTMTGPGGIAAPKNIKVYVSDDKTNWTEVGSTTYDKTETTEAGKYIATLEKDASGRYVKFETEHSTTWAFYDEVEVYGLSGGSTPKPTPPKTFDYGFVGFGIIAIISLAGVVVVSRKRV